MLRTVQLSILSALCFYLYSTTTAAVSVPASSSSSSLSRQGPSGICACIANTYDSRDCTSAVAAYCNGNKTADAGFCGGMLNVGQLKTNQTAASELVGFLATLCQPANGTVKDACTCFLPLNNDACALARLKLCAQGDVLCPAITLGLGATPDQAAYGRIYNQKTCQSNSRLEIEMVFAGIDQETFNTKYAAKAAAALANVTGVNIDQIAYNNTSATSSILDKQVDTTGDTTAANVTAADDNTTAAAAAAAAAKAAAATEAAKQAAAAAAAAAAKQADAAKKAAANKAAAQAAAAAAAAKDAAAKQAAAKEAAATAAAAAAKKAATAVPAEPAPVPAPKDSTADSAAAEATAKSKNFDAWASAPACSYPQTAKNANLDRLGRPWGYNSATGDSCAFKTTATPAQPKYADAPICSYKLTAANALPDRLGRLWGYDDATGKSCVFKEAAPAAAAPAAAANAPASKTTPAVAAEPKPAAASPPKASASTGSRRMLLQVELPDAAASNTTAVKNTAIMKYSVAAADAGRARRRFMDAVQNDGQLLYGALQGEGVPMRPAVFLSDQKLLAGDVPPSVNLSPRSGALSYYDAAALGVAPPKPPEEVVPAESQTALPEPVMIGIIVGSAVGGFALVGLLVWCCCRGRERKTAAERLKEQEAAIDAKLASAKDADSYGAVVRDRYAEAQKPVDQRAILIAPETPTTPATHSRA